MIKKTILTALLPCLMMTNAMGVERTNEQFYASPTPSATGAAFKQLEVGVTAATTGIGIDLSTPLSKSVKLRAGYTYMPKFTVSMKFGVGSEDNLYRYDEAGQPLYDEDGNPEFTEFGKMINLVEEFTGNKVNNEVTMQASPSMHNFKLLVDVHPFQNKRWRFTGGIYAGSSTIARVCNSAEDMPTLYAANMFNMMYEKAELDEPIVSMFGFDFYAGPALLEYGRIGLDMGVRADGSTYKMTPNEHCMVSVEARTNTVKPYLGFGYVAASLGKEQRTSIAFDCGALFWGGAPNLITHDGTNLTHDISGISGTIGQYVDIARKITVYPVVSIGVSYALFQR